MFILWTRMGYGDLFVLENAFFRVEILADESREFGTMGIVYLADKSLGKEIDLLSAGGGFGLMGVKAGHYYPMSLAAVSREENKLFLQFYLFQNTTGSSLPLSLYARYELEENCLLLQYQLVPRAEITFIDGLEIYSITDLWDSLKVRNHYALDENIRFQSSNKHWFLVLNQFYEFYSEESGLTIMFRNPYMSLVRVEDQADGREYFSVELLFASDPWKAKEPKGPRIASTLIPGDTLNFECEIFLTGREEAPQIRRLPIAYAYFSPYPHGYDQVIGMILDELPFKRWIYPKSSRDPEAPKQSRLIRLLENHPKMKMGWPITPDPITWPSSLANPDYPPGQWWEAHGVHRLATAAPQDYKDWLVSLERDEVRFGYEDRIHLGNHGYHHAPEMQFGANWEFQTYDPIRDDKTFDAIADDYQMIGLTERSLKFIRFPGFHFTKSALDALAKHGFMMFDFTIPWYIPLMPIFPYYHRGHRVWGISANWEGDTPLPFSVMERFLSKGKWVLTAGHAPKWTADDSAFALRDRIFTEAEMSYPNLGYVFPDEFGFVADEIYKLKRIRQYFTDQELVFCFEGKLQHAQTVMVESENPSLFPAVFPEVDQRPVSNFERRGKRLVIVLPPLDNGFHQLRIRLDPWVVDADVSKVRCYPNPSKSGSWVVFSNLPLFAKVFIFTENGLLVRVLKDSRGTGRAVWDLKNAQGQRVASGIYLFLVRKTLPDRGPVKKWGKLAIIR